MKLLVTLIAFLSGVAVHAQSVVPGEPVRPLIFDAAVLDLQEPRNDLPCSVTAKKPELGFDFLFYSGYQISIPLTELAGGRNMLTIVLRVRSERRRDQPVYFVQKIPVPKLEDGLKGNVTLDGAFRLGEGRYHVDWLMRDSNERVCSRFWDAEAQLDGKDTPLAQVIAKDLIAPVESTPFHQEIPAERHAGDRPLHVRVIVNFAPRRMEGATIEHDDLEGLVAILRKIGNEPRITSFSIVACSVRTQQVIYRQRNEAHIDFPALGEALKSVNFAVVDAKRLALKRGESDFLSLLLAEETDGGRPDAVIFVSPKLPVDSKVPLEIIEKLKDFDHSIFYLNYNPNPTKFPWRDAIGQVVKQLHGLEYTITKPRDLFHSWSDVVSRFEKLNAPAGNVSGMQ